MRASLELLWAEVDLSAIRHNVQALKQWVGPGVELAAVVKANGYGHGAVPAGQAALEAGASRLAVGWVAEGTALRQGGITAPILVMGYCLPEDAPAIVYYDLTPTVCCLEVAHALSDACQAQGKAIPIHVKVDTGMGRFGLLPEEVLGFLKEVSRLPGLHLEGLWTHFATADEGNKAYARQQFALYQEVLREVEAAGFRIPLRHAANSGATLDLPETHLDMVRCGIAIYGLYPSAEVARPVDLRPALTLKGRVGHVRTLPAGSSISYGRTFTTRRPTRVALVPVGYGDGYHRLHSNRGAVLIRGWRAPILGRVCMDQCVVDVTDIPGVRDGDEVVIIGRQG
ncbi:MAG: alanine racemase, partial [Anaerolineae bacterium]|nr:alanine racemase [Anaerolineae bacterium]